MTLKHDSFEESQICDIVNWLLEDRSFDHVTPKAMRSAVVGTRWVDGPGHDDINGGRDDCEFVGGPCPSHDEMFSKITFRDPSSYVASLLGTTCLGCRQVHWTTVSEDSYNGRTWYGCRRNAWIGDLYWLSSRLDKRKITSNGCVIYEYPPFVRYYATNVCLSCRKALQRRRVESRERALLTFMEIAAKNKKSFFRTRKPLPGEIRAMERRELSVRLAAAS